jgi:hypothetical protein
MHLSIVGVHCSKPTIHLAKKRKFTPVLLVGVIGIRNGETLPIHFSFQEKTGF